MSHELEFLENGEASMAYAGGVPWHSLGKSVPNDLSPEQMLEAAGLDWSVNKIPLSYEINGISHKTGRSALVRDKDNKCLDVISEGWEPVQNAEAFGFFYDWVNEGSMQMHTAGSLKGGKMVWALAKIPENTFEPIVGDKIESHLLFCNPHQYGKTLEIRLTNIRVVCNNTLTYALDSKTSSSIRLNHSKKFNSAEVKETLNLVKVKTDIFNEQSKFLASKKYSVDQVSEYLNILFPVTGEKKNELSRPAKTVEEVISIQPGAEFAPGTWWNLFNAVTYSTDHILGNSTDTRLSSAWFGTNQRKKIDALNIALEMAK